MKHTGLSPHILTLLVIAFFALIACNNKAPLSNTKHNNDEQITSSIEISEPQISEYIRNIYQDKNENLWLGTNGDGVAHYNRDSISYFANGQGFHGHQITGITEDPEGNIWFATDQGAVKYILSNNIIDANSFENYSDPKYFEGQRLWSIFADSKGIIWAGSVSGIYRFDGVDWKLFELPYPEDVSGEFITKGTTWSIIEDSSGNIWFSTNGFGVFKYDGQSFIQYSEKDGLTNNEVDIIMEDSRNNIWFGTRYGGISKYDGKTFINYTSKDSIGNNEICDIYEDKSGDIWFSSEGFGVYRYRRSADPVIRESFTNFGQEQGLGVQAVQTIFQDKEGQLWVGGGGGLYRLDGDSFINVKKNGPWD